MVKQDSEPIRPLKRRNVTKPSVSNIFVLLFSFAVQNKTAHSDTKVLNVRHQSQKKIHGILV